MTVSSTQRLHSSISSHSRRIYIYIYTDIVHNTTIIFVIKKKTNRRANNHKVGEEGTYSCVFVPSPLQLQITFFLSPDRLPDPNNHMQPFFDADDK